MGNDGIVIDANILKGFIDLKYSDSAKADPILLPLIPKILSEYRGAVSEMMKYEYKMKILHKMFNRWFEEQYVNGKFRDITIENTLDTSQRNRIFNKYGLDSNEKDIHYISCAYNTDRRYILTEDIHFFDPKMKQADQKAKNRVKDQRMGALCRYLKKEYSITVGTPEHCCTTDKLVDLNELKS